MAPKLHLLGPPRWRRESTGADPVERSIAPTDSLLLAWLALRGSVDRKAMSARLWPEKDEAAASRNLRQRIFRIRRALGDDVIVGDAVIALSPACWVDILNAEAQIATDALSLRDELLQGVVPAAEDLGDWLDEERALWRHRLGGWLSDCAERATAEGRIGDALSYASRLVEHWPEDEAHYHRQMRLCCLAGTPLVALEVYRRCEETLWRQDGRRPGAALRELVTAIERQASGALLPALSMLPHGEPPPLALVGREDAWRRLHIAWHARRVVLVSGEPGVGKSRLIGEFAATRGALGVGARLGDDGVSYSTVARVLRALHARCGVPDATWAQQEVARIAPWVDASPSGPTYRERLHEAIKLWLSTAWQRGVSGVAIDDLQYADAASLEVLLDAACDRDITQGRWVLAVRSGEWPEQVRHTASDPRSDGIDVMDLGPLDRPGVVRLLATAGFEPDRAERESHAYLRLTGGNPYFVLQTLLSLRAAGDNAAEPAPVPHLLALVQRRLARLGPLARELVQLLAIAQEDFSAEAVSRITGVRVGQLTPAWQELEDADLVRGTDFAHDLAREATLQAIPAPVAAALRRQLAEQGEATGMPAARQARHWIAVGDDARAARALMAAAADEGRLARRIEQAQWLDQARSRFERIGDQPQQFAALAQRVQVAVFTDSYDYQLARARELLALARDTAQRCEALAALARVLVVGQHIEQALPVAEEALALAGRLADGALRRRAALALAAVCVKSGREEEGIALCMAYVPQAPQVDDVATADLLINLGGDLARAGRVSEARPLLVRARATAQAAADRGLLARVLGNLGFAEHTRANVARAAVLYGRGLKLKRTTGPMAADAYMMSFIAVPRLYRELGRYDAALKLITEMRSAQAGERQYRLITNFDADLSFLWLQLGRPRQALEALRRADQPPPGTYAPSWLVARARIEHWSGRPAEAMLRACFDEVSRESRVLRWLAGRDLALALPPAEGLALIETLVDECSGTESLAALWPLRVARCERLHAVGRLDDAAEQARQVLAVFERRALPSMYDPQAWWIVGQALEAANCADDARRAYDRGRCWIQRALAHVPPDCRQSFLHDNPFNARLQGQGVNAAVTPSP